MKVTFTPDGLSIEAETPEENAAITHALRGGCYLPYLFRTWNGEQNAGIDFRWHLDRDIPEVLENVREYSEMLNQNKK